MRTTHGTLLGGRVTHEQPLEGHRTGLEPVLLAAAIPAKPGERVLEGGTGSGAGLLCLASRVASLRGVGVERDVGMAELARRNMAANAFGAAIEIVATDLLEFRAESLCDHAFANPPWHTSSGTRSRISLKENAKRAEPAGVPRWISALAGNLRHGGTLTVVLPATRLPECLDAVVAARCGGTRIFPLWPRTGRDAKLIIVQAIRDARSPCRLLPGLMLHGEGDGGFTPEATEILRDGIAISMA